MGEIALWVVYAAALGALAVLLGLIAGFLVHERELRYRATTPYPQSSVERLPVAVG